MGAIVSKVRGKRYEISLEEQPPRRGSFRGRGISLEGKFSVPEAQKSCRELLRGVLQAQKLFDEKLEELLLQDLGMQGCQNKEDFQRLREHLVGRCNDMNKFYLITDQTRIMEEALLRCNQFHRPTYGGMICRMMGEVRRIGMKFVWIALAPGGPGAINSVGEVCRVKFQGNRLVCLPLV